MDVNVYYRPGCFTCASTKEFLSQHNDAFQPRDVENDPAALAELKALGIKNVPVTVVGDTAVTGFDRRELTRVFKLDEEKEKPLADTQLFARLDNIMGAVIRATRQVPPERP